MEALTSKVLRQDNIGRQADAREWRSGLDFPWTINRRRHVIGDVRPLIATEPFIRQRSTFAMKQHASQHLLWFFSFIVLLTTLIVSFPGRVCAKDPVTPEPESVLDKLEGEWVMTGTVGDEEVTHDVDVDRILKRQYVRIHELSREKDADGDPAYEAWIHIAWDKEKAEYAVMWLDNTATTNFAPEGVGHAKPEGDRIPFVWKSADGSGIHNTFKYDRANDTWTWEIDNIDQSEKASPFARLTLKRKVKPR